MGTARLGQFVHGDQVSRKTLCLFLYRLVNNVFCEYINRHSHNSNGQSADMADFW